MNCRETQDLLEAYARGELDAARGPDVAAHLKSCADCRALHDDIFAVRVTLREHAAVTALSAAPDFNARAMAKFAALQSPETPNVAPTRRARQNPQAPLLRGLGVLPAFNFARRLWAPLALTCIALLICFAPPLRVAWQAQTAQSVLLTTPGRSLSFGQQAGFWSELRAVAARHPQDYRWAAVTFVPLPMLEGPGSAADSEGGVKRSAKAAVGLLPQHPNDPWLLARCLRATVLRERLGFREYQPLNAAQKVEIAKTMVPLAARGAALEPDNAFWNRMLAYWRFKAGDSDGALRAVSEAAEKKQFDDYTLEDRRQTFALLAAQRPLLAEEKLWVWPFTYLPTGGSDLVIGETVRVGARAEKAGDHARALSLYQSALRLCLNAPDNEMSSGPRLVQRVLLRGKPPTSLSRNAAILQNFTAYARQHGRADVANEALHVFNLVSQRDAAWQTVKHHEFVPGVPLNAEITLIASNIVQPSLRHLMRSGVWLWLALGALLLAVPRLVEVARWDLPAVLTAPSAALPAPRLRAVFGVLCLCLLAALGALLMETASADGFFDAGKLPVDVRWLLPWLPVFWALLGCWGLAVRAQERAAGRQRASLKQILAQNDLAALFPLMANWTLTLTTLLSWGALAATDDFMRGFVIALAFLCAALCLLRIVRRWARLPQRRAALGLAFVTLHRVLGASLVAGALLWIGLQIAVQPARRNVDQAIATLLRDGETKVILRRAAAMDAQKSLAGG